MSNAHLAYAIFDDSRLAYSSGNPVYRQEDTIPIQSDWSAEEVAVLVGLDERAWSEIFKAVINAIQEQYALHHLTDCPFRTGNDCSFMKPSCKWWQQFKERILK